MSVNEMIQMNQSINVHCIVDVCIQVRLVLLETGESLVFQGHQALVSLLEIQDRLEFKARLVQQDRLDRLEIQALPVTQVHAAFYRYLHVYRVVYKSNLIMQFLS